MDDQVVTNESFCDKVKNSCAAAVVGVILFFAMLALAGWNEYRNVATMKTLTAARDEFSEGTCSPIPSELEGRLVHLTCGVSNLQPLGGNDPLLQGISEEDRTGIYLDSYMEVRQWIEKTSSTKEEKTGGGTKTTTTYSYDRQWLPSTPVSNTSFYNQGETCKQKNGNLACYNWDPANVESWWSSSGYKLGTATIDKSPKVMAGDFILPSAAVSSIGYEVVLKPSCAGGSDGTASNGNSSSTSDSGNQRSLQSGGATLQCALGNTKPTLQGNKVTWKQTDSNGALIDYMTRAYTLYTSDTVSLIAQQKGDTFVNWQSPYDEDYGVFIFKEGNYTIQEMLEQAEATNWTTTWVIRVLTFILVIVGGGLFFSPLSTMPDIIPCVGPLIGDLVGCVTWLVAGMCGCCCWSIVVGITWLAYRPIIGIPLLVAALLATGGIGYAIYHSKQKKMEAEQQAGKLENNNGVNTVGEQEIQVSPEYDPETGAIKQ